MAEKENKELLNTEQLFCEYYVSNGFNGTQAYISVVPDCTYSTARTTAAEWLAKPHIKARVEELKAQTLKRLKIDADFVLKRHLEIDSLDVADLFDDEGNLLSIKEWPHAWRRSVSAIDVQAIKAGDIETVIKKLKMPDKLKNLELIGKYKTIDAYTRDKTGENDDTKPIDIRFTVRPAIGDVKVTNG